MKYKAEMELGGRTLSIETGEIAKQADGSALVRYSDTIVLVTACSEREPKPENTFFPLIVDYRENTYSAGKIPGGFFKREGRPTEKEILTARLVDRPIRPLFPDGFICDTQVVGYVMSADTENDPDTLSIIGASTALYLSNIPFSSPLAGVRVGLIDNNFVINPKSCQLENSTLNLIVAGTESDVVMLEGSALEVSEKIILDAINFAQEHIKKIIEMQKNLFNQLSVSKRAFEPFHFDQQFYEEIRSQVEGEINNILKIKPKKERYLRFHELENALFDKEGEDDEEKIAKIAAIFDDIKKNIFRKAIIEDSARFDGRAFNEIRPITCQIGLLPRTHGSALFTRGETQALATVTLGTDDDAQRVDDLSEEFSKRFILHYNFPPFSVGEVKFMRSPGRREIGHGALAERALLAVMPDEEKFPYTVRIVSDILESNGSSSMASVCGGSLALMDAGVPVQEAVAGVAMGLIKEGDTYKILSDIAGEEDHYGDMDFKVAGTRKGITAIQMDIKIQGISEKILTEVLEQARIGKQQILEKMNSVIATARGRLSVYAPSLVQVMVPIHRIKDVIGPGGRVIRNIIEQTGVKMDVKDNGKVTISSTNEEAVKKAMQMVKELTEEAEIGKTYMGTVQKVADFGAFIEILPNIEGLLHISEIANYRIEDIRSEIKEGDQILVKVIDIDEKGRIKLSRKALLKSTDSGDNKRRGEYNRFNKRY
jgi:polyribonucleotide nucleotidyltransferase